MKQGGGGGNLIGKNLLPLTMLVNKVFSIMSPIKLRWTDMLPFQFPSLDNEALPKYGLLIKERICF